ncbi:MAG: hypothetical protein ABFS32_17100 [Bacteroidota bacterium]
MVEYPENEEYPEEEEEDIYSPVLQVVSVPINRLRIHPLSKSIYRQRKNSRDIKNLAEDIRRQGQSGAFI